MTTHPPNNAVPEYDLNESTINPHTNFNDLACRIIDRAGDALEKLVKSLPNFVTPDGIDLDKETGGDLSKKRRNLFKLIVLKKYDPIAFQKEYMDAGIRDSMKTGEVGDFYMPSVWQEIEELRYPSLTPIDHSKLIPMESTDKADPEKCSSETSSTEGRTVPAFEVNDNSTQVRYINEDQRNVNLAHFAISQITTDGVAYIPDTVGSHRKATNHQ